MDNFAKYIVLVAAVGGTAESKAARLHQVEEERFIGRDAATD